MRRLYFASTLLFWLLVAALWVGDLWAPATQENAAPVAEKTYTAADLARHGTPSDCWMAIRGSVYDFSAYLPEHPSRPGLVEPWCGKEATEAYNTKTKGRPHSAYADELLARYRIGRFVAGKP